MVEVGSFSGLKSVYDILMGENDLESLKANMFTGLESVETISLYRNKIQAIQDGTFSGLDKLKTLFLSQNNISELSWGDVHRTHIIENFISGRKQTDNYFF